MLSTMLVLTAIMGVVNFSNYREMLDRADEMTALLEQNDGKFPEEPSWHEQDDTETPPAKPENNKKDKSRFSVETPFETRYFTEKSQTVIWTGSQRLMRRLPRNTHRQLSKKTKPQDSRESTATE